MPTIGWSLWIGQLATGAILVHVAWPVTSLTYRMQGVPRAVTVAHVRVDGSVVVTYAMIHERCVQAYGVVGAL